MKKRLLIVGGHGSGEITMSIFEDINVITNEWDQSVAASSFTSS